MLTQILPSLIIRDLNRLKHEILQYQNEGKLWHTQGDIANSAGNLTLHLIGNLNTYIGQALSNTGYIRHRDLEFSLKHIPKEQLLRQIDQCISMVKNTFCQLTEEDMQRPYPMEVSVENPTTAYYLSHIACHLSYHLGQINYHRRLLDK